MKIVYNNIIPFKGFAAINLFGVLFVRKGEKVTERMINHERIHTAQMREMWYVPFYVWYFIEWLIRLFCKGNAYKNLGFEKEAYSNDDNLTYLATRQRFAWWKYI